MQPLISDESTQGRMDGLLQLDHAFRMAKAARPRPEVRHFIREWRKHRKLTLEQLAERLGTTHATLSRIETGKMQYNQTIIEALAAELQTDPASLLMRDPHDTEGPWSIFERLPEMDRERAINILLALLGDKAEAPPADKPKSRNS